MSRSLFEFLSLLNAAFVLLFIPDYLLAAITGICIELILAQIATDSNDGECLYIEGVRNEEDPHDSRRS